MIRQTHPGAALPRSAPLESGQPIVRHLVFLGAWVVSLLVFHASLEAMVRLAFDDERYNFTLAIPLISAFLIWLKKDTIFAGARYRPLAGFAAGLAGVGIFVATNLSLRLPADYLLSIRIFACLVVWAGAFLGCYGTQVARACIFPLVFLFLAVPLPTGVLDQIAVALQKASAEVAYRLFKLVRMPVVRESMFRFALPGATIEVAEECSGIRSSVSMFISSIVAGYIFIRSGWSRAGFALLTIPIVIFKNAVRIVTISWLGVYVDGGFFTGRLHHYGGLPFSLVALALLIPALLLLMRMERQQPAL